VERLAFAGQDVRQPAISRNGRLAYASYPVNTNLWRLDLGEGGKGSVPGMRVEKAAIKLNASTRSDYYPNVFSRWEAHRFRLESLGQP